MSVYRWLRRHWNFNRERAKKTQERAERIRTLEQVVQNEQVDALHAETTMRAALETAKTYKPSPLVDSLVWDNRRRNE